MVEPTPGQGKWRGLLSPFARFTAFHGRHQQSPPVPGPADFLALPVVGVVVGAITAGFYFPFSNVLLPSDVGLLLALGWQAVLSRFLAEAGLGRLLAAASPETAAHRVPVVLALVIVLKFTILRQFFPVEAAILLLLGPVLTFCAPVLLAAMTAPKPADGRPAAAAVAAAVTLFLMAAVLLAGLRGLPTRLPDLIDALQPAGAMLIAGALALLVVAGYLHEHDLRGRRELLFGASLPVELTVFTALLSTRYLFL